MKLYMMQVRKFIDNLCRDNNIILIDTINQYVDRYASCYDLNKINILNFSKNLMTSLYKYIFQFIFFINSNLIFNSIYCFCVIYIIKYIFYFNHF